MIDLRTIDDLTRKLSAALPPGLGELSRDLEDQFKAILSRGLERLEVVTREEFDAQKAILAGAENKLKALEQQLAELTETGG